MPIASRRHRKPPRLWFDAAKGRWLILDGTARENTGCSHGEGGAAQQKLIRYIEAQAEKVTNKPGKKRPADRVSCAEVIGYYLDKKGASVARPKELGQRCKKLLEFWGDKNLDEVDGDNCDLFEDYVESASYARRMLGDFQAAINMYKLAGFLRDVVQVSLPDAPEARQDYLSHEEALLMFRMMRTEKLDGRFIWRHLIPYFGVSIVTCSRASRVYRCSFVPEKGRPHIDVRTGRYTRRFSGERVTKKKAPAIDIQGRLLVFLRMMARDRQALDGATIPGLRYVCQYPDEKGEPKAADPKRAFATVLRHAARRRPDLFRREDGEPKELVRHSLRHTGITWMAMAGVDPYQILRYAGISMKVFEDVYAHAFPGGLDAVKAWQSRVNKLTE
jgi:integrase